MNFSNIRAQVLPEFNKQFFELLDDIDRIFPNKYEVKTTRFFMKTLSTLKPKCIIEFMNMYILKPYGSHIKGGNLDFFSNNDFSNDSNVGDSEYVLDKIKMVVSYINMMTESEKKTVAIYLQNMAELCEIYYSSSS